jgi:TctA family transporter
MTDHASLFWGLVVSFWIGNVLLLILNIPLIGLWVSILRIPGRLLHPVIICLICIGVYSINTSIFDVWMVLIFGVLGYGMRLLHFEPAPLLIGFILGPMVEENFRRAMLIAEGNFMAIMERPIAGTLLVVTLAALVALIGLTIYRRGREVSLEAGLQGE